VAVHADRRARARADRRRTHGTAWSRVVVLNLITTLIQKMPSSSIIIRWRW
jgi:hypothetical protein